MDSMAYIKGVLDGDGSIDRWNTNPRICLSVTSKDFAIEFAEALKNVNLIPYMGERTIRSNHQNHPRFKKYDFICHFFWVRATCKPEFVQSIRNLEPTTDEEKLSYLKGFYDSDGHSHIKKYPDRECYQWKITKNDLQKLERVQKILEYYGIKSTIRNYSLTKSYYLTPFIEVQKKLDVLRLHQMGLKIKVRS